MGKRKKAAKPVQAKKKDKLPTNFQCLFCNHENSVGVKMDKKAGIGTLDCKTCGQKFQSTIGGLSAPVDVYADWIDACDSVAKEQASGPTGRSVDDYGDDLPRMTRPAEAHGTSGEMDDFLEDDEEPEGEFET